MEEKMENKKQKQDSAMFDKEIEKGRKGERLNP